MGSWNGTCAISNLHIHSGKKVAVFLLAENKEKKSFCYGNALYDICPIPFYGEYNDYGSVENCHGFGMNIVVDELSRQLYEFGEGPNSYHDLAVRRDNFDIDLLFEADHEDRLGIQYHSRWSSDAHDQHKLEEMRGENSLTPDQQFELDRLASKIKKDDTFRRVTHVIIHGDIFNDIIEKWYIEEYVGDGKGTAGYGMNYNHIYFKDIVADIPAYVQTFKDRKATFGDEGVMLLSMRRSMRLSDSDDWNSPNYATKWMNTFSRGGTTDYSLVDVNGYVQEYIETDNWDGLASFAKEAITGLWINTFMSYTRKVWTQQAGMGSQNSDHFAYNVLIQSMADALTAERAEYDMDVDTE